MDIRQNHFELFGLPQRFALDSAALEVAYRQLQAQVHPDRYAGAGAAERRVALQWATHVNGAYQALRHPLQRAIYLCALNGIDLHAPGAALPPEFLMLQMETREALAEASAAADVDALERMAADGQQRERELVADLTRAFDEQHDPVAAAAIARQLMFLARLGEEIEAALATLEA